MIASEPRRHTLPHKVLATARRTGFRAVISWRPSGTFEKSVVGIAIPEELATAISPLWISGQRPWAADTMRPNGGFS